MKGYLQVYTGDGKGKTTAAIGLAIRAAGAGLTVLFAQFAKRQKYSEIAALERFADRITIRQYGREGFIVREAEPADREAAKKGLREVGDEMAGDTFDVVILDEAAIAVHFSLFTVAELLDAIKRRRPSCEVIVTGRNAPQELVDAADLVTEMREVKHYFAHGVAARTGIEQ
jgi:cob(I)alamin adenosyltransferase